MKRKIMSCFLCGLCLLYCFLGFVPVRGYAIVPVSLVESALASYTVSAGYKWYSDGSGAEMSQSITNLYNTWYDAVGKNIDGVLTLAQFAAGYGLPSDSRGYVYLDNSGQIVISKVAADVFQQFSDWIQTQYSVPVGSETPTEVQSATVGGYTLPAYQDTGWIDVVSVADVSSFYQWAIGQASVEFTFTSSVQSAINTFLSNHAGAVFAVQAKNSTDYMQGWSPITLRAMTYLDRFYLGNSYRIDILETYGTGSTSVSVSDSRTSTVQRAFPFVGYRNDYYLEACNVNAASVAGSGGLAVSLAQAVADVVGQATDDDAVVIGVGAGVGATAQDIASLVADGMKAGTLDPSVSITAEAVIDTPVQPYPDIDGLGLPSLGAELVSRFPFCIPWDFVDVVKLFSAEPVAPRFQFDIVPSRVKTFCNISQSTTIDLNMGDPKFEKIGVFCRWGSLIGFCWGLVLLTKRMIWTA